MTYRAIAAKFDLSFSSVMRAVKGTRAYRSAPPELLFPIAPDTPDRERRHHEKLAALQRQTRVIVLDGRAPSISVRNGALICYCNDHERTYLPGSPWFDTIWLDGHGAQLTGAALAFCERYGIAVHVTCDGRTVALAHGQPLARLDIRRAQYAALARPHVVARPILLAKLDTCREHERLTRDEFKTFALHANRARNVPELLTVEAQAARLYFNAFAQELTLHGRGKFWPEEWRKFPGRNSLLNTGKPRGASHPINAALNLAYTVAANQLARYLAAYGFDTACGYLHLSRDDRHSLAWDLVELHRADIDTRVAAFLSPRAFARSDFPLDAATGTVRLSPPLARAIALRGTLTKSALASTAAFMTRLVTP